jgi:ubiquilin
MAEDAAAASTEEPQITFNVKSSSDAKYVLTVPASITVADLKTKLSTAEYADLPVDRQRLIYSGRVLKDHDTVSSVKIKDGHTVHLVKGAAMPARTPQTRVRPPQVVRRPYLRCLQISPQAPDTTLSRA